MAKRMRRNAVHNPWRYCPVCGHALDVGATDSHKCLQRQLSAIDGAHHRDPDEEEPRQLTEGQRLNLGFDMLDEDYEG